MCRRVIGGLVLISLLLAEKAIAVQYAYIVYFTDKNATPYSLSSPLAYLSARALARRATQGIAVDSTDIPVNATYIHSALTLTGGIFHESSRWLNMCVILLADSANIHALDGQPFVKSTKYVAYYSSALHYKETSTGQAAAPASPKTTSDADYYGLPWAQTQLVNGNYLHDKGFDGTGMLIAVLDAGFTYTDTHFGFDSLRNSGRIVESYNFTYANTNVFAYGTHGTEVLSDLAGYVANNSPNNFVGSAPLASYALYVTEDNASEQPIELANMLCATERADSLGADVISSSLGYNTFDNSAFDFNFATDFNGYTTIAARAANIATTKGMLFVASAGNEGGDSWNMILTPGDADSALTIGSVDIYSAPASNTGYGPNAAGRTKPDVCGMGVAAACFSSNAYSNGDGTSFAVPQIAGWATCLWQANRAATPFQIRQAIIKCASNYLSPTAHTGYGVPNFYCTEQLLDIKDIHPNFSGGRWVAASPNPAAGDVRLDVSPADDGLVHFVLTDMAGRRVYAGSQYLYRGYNTPLTLPTGGLADGIYLLRAVSATQQQVLKIERR